MKRSEFELWLNSRDTRKVLRILQDEIKSYENAVIEGVYAREETMEKVAGKYIWSSAYLTGLKFILTDLVNHLEDDINEQEE